MVDILPHNKQNVVTYKELHCLLDTNSKTRIISSYYSRSDMLFVNDVLGPDLIMMQEHITLKSQYDDLEQQLKHKLHLIERQRDSYKQQLNQMKAGYQLTIGNLKNELQREKQLRNKQTEQFKALFTEVTYKSSRLCYDLINQIGQQDSDISALKEKTFEEMYKQLEKNTIDIVSSAIKKWLNEIKQKIENTNNLKISKLRLFRQQKKVQLEQLALEQLLQLGGQRQKIDPSLLIYNDQQVNQALSFHDSKISKLQKKKERVSKLIYSIEELIEKIKHLQNQKEQKVDADVRVQAQNVDILKELKELKPVLEKMEGKD